MAQPQFNISLTAPGFAGVNTQDSPLDMDQSFAVEANNCVIDRFGRISSRKGFQYITSNPEILNGKPIVALHEFLTQLDGDQYVFATGNNQIYLQQTVAPFELVPLTLPVGYTITADNWQFATLNDKCFMVQAGHEPLVFVPAESTTSLRVWADGPGQPDFQANGFPNVIHAAYGRIWTGNFDGNSEIFAWSSLLNGEDYQGQGSGTATTEEFWPSGYDRISSINVHNNFLLIFGENNILIYQTDADVVNNLRLIDTIAGVGCINRDSVESSGKDLMFVDATGVRSFARVVQEKSLPIGDVSRNVRQDFQEALKVENKDDVKAFFHPEDSFYAVFLPNNPQTYVFDTWNPLPPEGAARVTTWTLVPVRCGYRLQNRNTIFGGDGGVYSYVGGNDVRLDVDNGNEEIFTPIPMSYITHPMDFGEPSSLIFPKQVDVVVSGGNLIGDLTLKWGYDYRVATEPRAITKPVSQAPAAFWYPEGTALDAEGVAEYFDPFSINSLRGKVGYYTSGESFATVKYNIWGSGRNIRLGFFASTLGLPLSIQQVNIQALKGRLL